MTSESKTESLSIFSSVEINEKKSDGERTGLGVRRSTICPYLDTINRRILDFDFEKCCSVSLSHVNVYACLVCGKYFQGRGRSTHAYTHCLEATHHMFMRLEDGSVWCLPDNYKVEDRSLDDIRSFLNPTFSIQEIKSLDKPGLWYRALAGTEVMPGLVGLNNMKANSYANVVIQILACVRPLRNFFLNENNYRNKRSLLLQATGELLRKIWHPRQFKGQVSPLQFLQIVMSESQKQFMIEKEGDPLLFLIWLLNALENALTDGMAKKHSILTQTFKGELEVWTEGGTGSARDIDPRTGLFQDKVERLPFFILALDLPQTPLFKDMFDRMQLPQISLAQLLKKYNSDNIHEDVRKGRRRYRITRLPDFLILSIRRFTKNNFFWEKNPSIVNFPIKNLDIKDIIPLPNQETSTKYDLLASVSHEGDVWSGTYKTYINRNVEETWYEVQDLTIVEVLPQMVALSEAYLQVYERHGLKH